MKPATCPAPPSPPHHRVVFHYRLLCYEGTVRDPLTRSRSKVLEVPGRGPRWMEGGGGGGGGYSDKHLWGEQEPALDKQICASGVNKWQGNTARNNTQGRIICLLSGKRPMSHSEAVFQTFHSFKGGTFVYILCKIYTFVKRGSFV